MLGEESSSHRPADQPANRQGFLYSSSIAQPVAFPRPWCKAALFINFRASPKRGDCHGIEVFILIGFVNL